MKYFVGLLLPDHIVDIMEAMRSRCKLQEGISFPVTPLHMTLVPPFDGSNVDIQELVAQLETLAMEPAFSEGIRLKADRVDIFGDGDVLVLCYNSTGSLSYLRQSVMTLTRLCGAPTTVEHSQRFNPHITLVKAKGVHANPNLLAEIQAVLQCLQDSLEQYPEAQAITLRQLAVFEREGASSWCVRNQIHIGEPVSLTQSS